MKNMIIAALSAYIFYSFCEIRNLLIPVTMFLLVWIACQETDEIIHDFQKSVKRGQRLQRKLKRAGRSW